MRDQNFQIKLGNDELDPRYGHWVGRLLEVLFRRHLSDEPASVEFSIT